MSTERAIDAYIIDLTRTLTEYASIKKGVTPTPIKAMVATTSILMSGLARGRR
jgi:hypothetical protein